MIQEPKSQAAKRTNDLDPATVAELRARKEHQAFRRKSAAFWHDNDFVFCTGDGKLLNPNNLYRTLDVIMERAKVPRIRLHDLWHTRAMLLLAAGTPIKAVSERLGRSKTSIALDTYATCCRICRIAPWRRSTKRCFSAARSRYANRNIRRLLGGQLARARIVHTLRYQQETTRRS